MSRVGGAWGTIALGVAFLLGAAGFGSPPLYLPGVALTLLGLASIAWVELAARGAHLARAAGPSKVVEGEPYPLRVTVRGALLPPPGGRLVDPVLEDEVRLGPGWRGEIDLEVRLERRGRLQLEPTRLIVGDPLGLHSREVRSPGGGEVLVLPRVEPVVAAGERGGGAGGPGALGEVDGDGSGPRPDAPGVDFEIDGLRPYRDGSPASRIHWPSVARTGELVERRLLSGAGSARLVVVDARHPASEADLDKAVRAAASLCVHLARAGGCTLLVPGASRSIQIDQRLGGWPSAHTRLALIGSGDGMPALGRVPRAAAIFWVTAAETRRPPGALMRFGAPSSYLVTPSPIDGYAAAFAVAGCEGLVVASARRRGPRIEGVAA